MRRSIALLYALVSGIEKALLGVFGAQRGEQPNSLCFAPHFAAYIGKIVQKIFANKSEMELRFFKENSRTERIVDVPRFGVIADCSSSENHSLSTSLAKLLSENDKKTLLLDGIGKGERVCFI